MTCRLPLPGMAAFAAGAAMYAALAPAGGSLLAGGAGMCAASLVLAGSHRRGLSGWAAVDAAVAAGLAVGAAAHHGPWTSASIVGWLDTSALVAVALAAVAAALAAFARAAARGLPRRGEEGLATAELVILIPVLLAVVGLAVVGGRITTAEGEVQSAVRAAARAASLQRDPADAQAAADQAAQAELQTAGVTCGSYTLQVAVGAPGGVDQATLSCVVPLGGVEWMNVAASKTIVASFSSPVDEYRENASGFGISEGSGSTNSGFAGP